MAIDLEIAERRQTSRSGEIRRAAQELIDEIERQLSEESGELIVLDESGNPQRSDSREAHP